MNIKECYKTVKGDGEAVVIEKKSKFIATVKPVTSDSEAQEFVADMRSKYSDATHNVYAYAVAENNIFRYSDDGEPSGTAGMPVLDTIRKEGLTDVAVVVTRYFGGTLLGTGGLVHTYGAACREGLSAAGIVTRILCDVVSVKADYTLAGKLQYMISEGKYILKDTVYENEVTFKVCLKKEEIDKFISDATEITCGRAVIKKEEKKYIDV